MSCISSNFSSFFLNSLNDPSEFSKYLSNGELRFSSTFEDFQVYGQNNAQQQQQQQHYQQQQQHHISGGVGVLCNANGEIISSNGDEGNSNIENTQPVVTSVQHYGSYQGQQMQQHHPQQQQTRWALPHQQTNHQQNLPLNAATASASAASASGVATAGTQHFDGSFEFMKYLRHSNDYNDNAHDAAGQSNQTQSSHAIAVGTKPEASLNNGLMDLDNAHKRTAARKTPVLSSVNSNHHNSAASNSSHPTPMDIYDHDSKHNIYDLHHMNSVHSSNSNESSMELSSMNYPNSHLNASNSNTSSEGGNTQNHSDFSMLSGVGSSQNSSTANAATTAAATAAATASPAAPKPLATFTIKDNFEVHPSHKVEEGIFQHMNKLPSKKKDNLKQLGVRFTGQMTLKDKSIIVENFIKFCQEYEITDHRPFLSLNQSGLNKPDQIKFARYLGQGLPTFTLFCIYSNFKNLFCTKRTEIYTKEGYNLPYILDKIKRFLANTTAGNNNNNASNSSSTTTTTKDSSSNSNSTNSNTTPNTTTVNANNSNNNNNNNSASTAVPVAMQNGNSNSNGSSSSSSGGTGNDIGSSSSSSNNNIISNDIINTPTKQIHNVPSPATPQIQQQQTPQIPIQSQNTPLPAHPPPPTHATHIMANHPATPQTHLQQPHHHHHHNLHQQQQQQLPHHPHQQQQHPHHLVQIPMSPMVVVASAPPSTIMASPLAPTVSATATVTQSTTNHNQHPLHMQPNNHLPLHHHPHLVHPVASQPSIQHHTTAAAVVYQQQQQQHQQHQQHHHHQQQQQQLQNHHPLHNLAAQNPPL